MANAPAASPSTMKIDFAVGGQAVIEGVMMRSPNFITVAVRKPQGDITLKDEAFQSIAIRLRFLGIPLLRGIVNMIEMMTIGAKMLNFSASQALEDEDKDKDKVKVKDQKEKHEEKAEKKIPLGTAARFGAFISAIFSFIFALGMSLFLFKFLPLWITDYLSQTFTTLKTNWLIFNLIDGFIKTTFFVTYIGIIGLMPSMKRIFQYHGAEHKSIYTYEQGKELTVANAKTMTRFHPRCGTSFILVVFFMSIFIYTFVPRQPDFWANFALRVVFLPFIAGISYEILKWSAKHAEHRLVKIITWPGLMFQRLTTKEPDESQLEVALSALKKALELENLHLQKTTVQADVP